MAKARKKIETRPFDAAAYIETADDIVAMLEAAFEQAAEDGDARIITETIGDIARSKGMTALAEQTGLSREALYRALSADGNPTLNTMFEVLGALGVRLTVVEHRRAVA